MKIIYQKFIVCIMIMVAGIFLLFFDKISPGEWLISVSILTGFYWNNYDEID